VRQESVEPAASIASLFVEEAMSWVAAPSDRELDAAVAPAAGDGPIGPRRGC